ncbi:phage holin family protein [Psychroserpens damuponensis]|uniref:phage holin family protein n=1 Tax=Psychroserpens damuponensis TaxID=943936 RepID=UPI00058EE613|nr:phage holin family protein [Psychroserpens damuponensis]
MTVFESLNETTDKATDTAERYYKTSKTYFKLKVFQQLTLTLSFIVKFAIIGGLVAFALIFMSIAGAMAIGEELESLPLGYLIVGLVYLVLSFILYFLKGKINTKIIQSVSNKFFDE